MNSQIFHCRARMTHLALLPILAAILLYAVSGHAQNYTIDWSTIDGGGGTSAGGGFSVSGTIGQPDAGVMSGGNFSVTGGFWSLISVVQTPGVLLSIQLTSTNTVVLAWPSPSAGFALVANNSLASTNWVQVAQTPSDDGVTKRIILPAGPGVLFLRLKK